jgi:hypothetical protein
MDYHGEPFRWDDPLERRAQLRAELDATYARLYSLTRDELRYILDPKDVHGEDFPGQTFRVPKEKEIKQFGEYCKLCVKTWEMLAI